MLDMYCRLRNTFIALLTGAVLQSYLITYSLFGVLLWATAANWRQCLMISIAMVMIYRYTMMVKVETQFPELMDVVCEDRNASWYEAWEQAYPGSEVPSWIFDTDWRARLSYAFMEKMRNKSKN